LRSRRFGFGAASGGCARRVQAIFDEPRRNPYRAAEGGSLPGGNFINSQERRDVPILPLAAGSAQIFAGAARINQNCRV